jgi:hypothetical protein
MHASIVAEPVVEYMHPDLRCAVTSPAAGYKTITSFRAGFVLTAAALYCYPLTSTGEVTPSMSRLMLAEESGRAPCAG